MNTNPTLISLFAGAGGLDIGLEQAGFVTVAASDADRDCVATLSENKAGQVPVADSGHSYLDRAEVIHADVRDLKRKDLVPAGVRSSWVPDLLAGGPPCQPFSSSGKQRSVLDQERGRLFEHFVRLAQELRPRTILFENVRGLVTARGVQGTPGEVLADVRDAFHSVGYTTTCALLNSADYGSHQRRVRFFLLGTRCTDIPSFPSPTHQRGVDEGLFDDVQPWRTLGEFLKSFGRARADEIVRPSESLRSQLESLSPGSGLKSNGRAEPTRPGGHWGYKQGTFIADPHKPARTVTAASTQDWIKLRDGSLRRLTLRECAALQGFPRDWAFAGNKSSQFRQVGNAVPAVFGQVLGQALLEALGRRRRKLDPPADLPKYMNAAIAYTKRDHERNAEARHRTNALVVEARKSATKPM